MDKSIHPQADVLREFAALVAPGVADEHLDLLRAALLISRTEYPSLDVESCIIRVEQLAERVRAALNVERHRHSEVADDNTGIIAAINRVFFEEEHFTGNTENYYDPSNSFLNKVLERRMGIPITLAVLYMEIARRVGLPLFGVGMPGHFLLKFYDLDANEKLIDVFSGGEILSEADCQARLDEIFEGEMPLEPEHLHAVDKRQILTRMLNNLKSIYITQRNFRRALVFTDLSLTIYPRSPEDVKQRALLRYNTGMLKQAADDLEEYLKILPEASDADEVRHTALAIRRTIAMMN